MQTGHAALRLLLEINAGEFSEIVSSAGAFEKK
jgi:hypothetical protein